MISNRFEIRQLSVSYSGVDAVKELSFCVKPGETLAIVGESGSGKSTTALASMGLVSPFAQVKLPFFEYTSRQGKVFSANSIPLLRGKEMSMVFQNPMSSLNPVISCGNQAMEPLLIHLKHSKSEAIKQVFTLFEEAGLSKPEEIFKSYPNELSGGQKQRVMIAMAMACNPGILFADEPTTSLDVTIQADIIATLKEVQRQRDMSMVFISHDIGLVSQIADRVLVMHQGELIEEGPTKQVIYSPKQGYTKGLLACRPPLNKRLERLPTVGDFLNDLPPNFKEISTADRTKTHETIYSKEPLIKVKNLNVSFDKRTTWLSFKPQTKEILSNIQFELYPGETLGLVGESGSGKTTLGRALAQLIPIEKGEIFFDGRLISTLPTEQLRRERRNIQMVFQDPFTSLNPKQKISEILLEPMRAHKIGKNEKERIQLVITLLNKIGLNPNILKRYPHEFSGGQRQRIGIARALLLNPKCIIFDESVSSLDVSIQAQVLNTINELKQEFGFSCLFISHDLAVVRYMSDRVLVMEHGVIVESNESDELFKHPKSEYTKKLVAAIPAMN